MGWNNVECDGVAFLLFGYSLGWISMFNVCWMVKMRLLDEIAFGFI